MSMNIFKIKAGDFVRHHTQDAGMDSQREAVKKYLTVGETYKVRHVTVGDWVTIICLDGFEKPFNSVFFENI